VGSDTRPRVALGGKAVVLCQLAAEVGAALTANDDEVVVADPAAAVTQQQLATAVANHVADPTFNQPPEQQSLASLRSKAQAVLAGTDSFTTAQVQKLLAAVVVHLAP
jgi:hypothetical protein